ncbi:hypothetical protein WJX79_004798 [Trebouxia sp. C0005]
MSQSVATFIADRTQLETVSPHTSPPKLNSRAAQKAEHIPACHQLHSDGHVNASRSEATEPFSDPTGRGVGPSVSSSTSTGAAAETDTAASEQHQVPSENDTDGTDADTPVRYEQRRSGRTKPRVVYQEPKLRTKLRQGDAFTFGIAESTPRSAMRRKRVMPRQKANLESPNKTCAAVSVLKQQPSESKNRTLQS